MMQENGQDDGDDQQQDTGRPVRRSTNSSSNLVVSSPQRRLRNAMRLFTGEGSGFSSHGRLCGNQQPRRSITQIGPGPTDGGTVLPPYSRHRSEDRSGLIKVDGKSDFPYVKFADQAPKVGIGWLPSAIRSVSVEP